MSSTATFVLASPSHALEATGLHDATLESVSLNWQSAEAEVNLSLVGTIRATLVFHGVESVILPRLQPWGPSVSVNSASTLASGEYELEMQSGDSLRFKAASWLLRIGASPADA